MIMHGTGLNFNTTPKTFQDCRSIHFWNFFLSIRVLRPIRTMKVLFFIRVLMVFSERPVSSQASLTDIRILSLSAACIFYVSYILQPISAGRWYWLFLLSYGFYKRLPAGQYNFILCVAFLHNIPLLLVSCIHFDDFYLLRCFCLSPTFHSIP